MSKNALPPQIEQLSEALTSLPGIGPRNAMRLAIYLATREGVAGNVNKSLSQVVSTISECVRCGNLSIKDKFCTICADNDRDRARVVLVETPTDLLQVEGSGVFTGTYLVLGRLLSPAKGIGIEETNFSKLEGILSSDSTEELIIALTSSVEGEATALYVANEVGRRFPKVKISRLAKGLPTGVDIEYLDQDTIKGAFGGRTTF